MDKKKSRAHQAIVCCVVLVVVFSRILFIDKASCCCTDSFPLQNILTELCSRTFGVRGHNSFEQHLVCAREKDISCVFFFFYSLVHPLRRFAREKKKCNSLICYGMASNLSKLIYISVETMPFSCKFSSYLFVKFVSPRNQKLFIIYAKHANSRI